MFDEELEKMITEIIKEKELENPEWINLFYWLYQEKEQLLNSLNDLKDRPLEYFKNLDKLEYINFRIIEFLNLKPKFEYPPNTNQLIRCYENHFGF